MKKIVLLLVIFIIVLMVASCRKPPEGVTAWDGLYPEASPEGLGFSQEPIDYLMPDGSAREVYELIIDSNEKFAFVFGRNSIALLSDKKNLLINITQDIYLNKKTWTPADITENSSAELIIINGMGHCIYNLRASGELASLFYAESCHLVVINLTLANSSIKGSSHAAALVCSVNGKYSFVNCALENVTIRAKGNAGGFTLIGNGWITNCALYKVNISADSCSDQINVGGVASELSNGIIRDISFTKVTIEAHAKASENRKRIGLFTAIASLEAYITGEFIVNDCKINKNKVMGTSDLVFTDNRSHRIFDDVIFVK